MSNRKKTVEDELLRIAERTVPKKAWLSLSIMVILNVAVLIWSIFGTLTINVEGQGMILTQDGLCSIESSGKGVITSIEVKPGDYVQKGMLVASIHDASGEMLLKTNQIKKENLLKELHHLRHQVEIEKEAFDLFLRAQLHALQIQIKTIEEKLSFLTFEYRKKEALFNEGLIIRNVLQESERQMSQGKISLEETKKEMLDIEFQLAQSYRSQELKLKEGELFRIEEEVRMNELLMSQNKIYSQFDGRVLDVLVNLGQIVREGIPLCKIELISPDQSLMFYGFFPAQVGKQIQKESVMSMELPIVNKKEYGVVLSQVKTVSEWAISEKAMLNQIQNRDLARFLSKQQPVIQVIAQPILDPQDSTKFSWTSMEVPPLKLTPGLVGKVTVTIEKIHPIDYLIPRRRVKNKPLGVSL